MKLRKYMHGYWFKTIVGAFFKFVEAAFELMLPLLMAYVIDEGIKKDNADIVTRMTLMMLVLVVFGYLSSITCQYLASVVSQNFGYRIRSVLLKKINTFSFGELDNFSSSTLTNRLINDVNQIQWGVAMTIRLAIRAPFLMIGSFVMIYLMNAELAGTLALFIPLFVIVIIGIMYLSMLVFKKVQVQTDKISSVVQDYLHGVRIIRSFAKDKHEKDRFDKKNEQMNRLLTIMGSISSLSNPLTTILMNVALVIMVRQGAFQALEGSITQGEIIAIINYCQQMLLAFIVFINLVLTYARAFSARKRVVDVLETPISIYDKEDAITFPNEVTSIKFSHVDFYYPKQSNPSLKDINLEIKQKEMIGIVGLTGSGKTSLLNLIARFYDIQKGSLTINEVDIKEYQLKSLHEHIGFVSQKSALLSGDIEENLKMGKQDATDADMKDALEIAQAMPFIDEKEEGIKEPVNREGSNFSGGQKQRLHIARALMKKPSILIMDDVFSALDYATDRRLREALNEKLSDMTCIIASQRISSVRNADMIVVLDKGEIIAKGTHDDLLEACDLYKKMYESQTQEVSYV